MSAIVVAVNPTAARGRAERIAARAAERFGRAGHAVDVLRADHADELSEGIRAALRAPDARALVAIGGDGMVHLAVQIVAGSTVPLGIVPAGTGNDIARSLGIPHRDPDAAVDRIIAAFDREPRAIDAIRTGDGQWIAGVLSAGFDAAVNERANRLRRPRGESRYVVALIGELARLRAVRYRLTIDDTTTEVPAVLVTVGNTTMIGGGMRITPDAVPDDGLLDVLVASPLSRAQLLRIFPRVFAGTHTGDPHVSIVRARHVRIETPDARPPVAYGDGERIGPLPIDLRCMPNALNVLG